MKTHDSRSQQRMFSTQEVAKNTFLFKHDHFHILDDRFYPMSFHNTSELILCEINIF